MKIRLEFSQTKSKSFPWVLRLCRAFPSFGEFHHDGLVIYSVGFKEEDLKSFEAIWNKVGGWNDTALYLDGKLVHAGDLFEELNRKRIHLEYRGNADDDQGTPLSKRSRNTAIIGYLKKNGIMANPN